MAGRIPQSFINDLLARVDIVEIIDARLKLKKAGKNYQALCPFHNEKSPSFSVSPDKQFYHCFGCGVSGTALTFLMEHDGLDFIEAVETLAAGAGLEVPREQGGAPRREHTDLYELLERAGRFYQEQLRQSPEAIEYLKSRGVTGIVARDFGIGYAPDQWNALGKSLGAPEARLLAAGLVTQNERGRVYDRFRHRIMFPIRDTRGRIIGFGGRLLGAQEGPKYLNSPETPLFHKGNELYGLYEARRALRQLRQLVVVEGYMDVVALAQHDVPWAVATLGTAAGESHFRKLYRYAEDVVCCFDGDRAGREAAWRALEAALPVLEGGRQLRFVFLPEGEDPDTLVRSRGSAGFRQLLDGALPAIEYLFRRLSDGLDLKVLDDQARLANSALPLINRVPDGVLKDLMRNRLTQLTDGRLATGAAPRPAPGRPPGGAAEAGAGRGPGRGRSGRLNERLLQLLLGFPSLLIELSDEKRQRLLALPQEGLFLQVCRYLDGQTAADASDIIGAHIGEPAHPVLMRLATTPLELDSAGAAREFRDGVDQLLAATAREERLRLLDELKETQDREKFMRLMSLKGQGGGEGEGLT